MKEDVTYKTEIEIRSLANKLTPVNQLHVLNAINALLFSQSADKEEPVQSSDPSERSPL